MFFVTSMDFAKAKSIQAWNDGQFIVQQAIFGVLRDKGVIRSGPSVPIDFFIIMTHVIE